jgi:hypothetical protein
VLHREDEGTLVYCWNCGAPQVQLSEELREQLDQQITAQHAAANPSAAPTPAPAAPTNAVVWRGAIQTAALAGAIAAALTLLTFALPLASLLSFFWFISAPIIVLGIYHSRHRITRITTGFGARLGLLTGLVIFAATVTLDTIGLVLQRFVFHSTAEIDKQLATLFTQFNTGLAAQPSPYSKDIISSLTIPEFRIGFVLISMLFGLCLYLTFSATAGAFAGYLRSRTPRT